MKKFFTFFAAALTAITMSAATTMTCADAAAAALSVSANNEEYNNGEEIVVQGYVTSIAYALSEGSMSFWMADTKDGGQVLEAYKCAIANEADAPKVGDKVEVTGKLTKYNTTPEFAPGCTCKILERSTVIPQNLGQKTIAEFLALKSPIDTCILTGVVDNIVMDKDDPTQYNIYGNFDIVDETGTLYVYGLLTPEGQTKQFRTMGVDAGDTLTVMAIYNEYNSKPQAKNAIFVSLKEGNGSAPVVTADVVFDKNDFAGQGVASTGGPVSAEKNGVTFTCDKGFGDGTYGVRCYKGSTVTIISATEQIAKIEFDLATVSGKDYSGGLDPVTVVNAKEWTVTLPSQARMNKISIYFGTAEAAKLDTITAAEAKAMAEALAVGATSDKVAVKAYVASIDEPYSPDYGNITIWLTDDPTSTYGNIKAYRAKCTEEVGNTLMAGNQVLLVGKLSHTTYQPEGGELRHYYEIAQGAELTLLATEGIEEVVLTENVQKVMVDGVLYIVRDNKMYNVQGVQVR